MKSRGERRSEVRYTIKDSVFTFVLKHHQVQDILILLVDAQSVFSINVALRILLYRAATYKEYVEERKLNLYGAAPVTIPHLEVYVVYTGDRTDVPRVLQSV